MRGTLAIAGSKRIALALATLVALIASASQADAQQSGVYGHYDIYDADLLPREEYASRRSSVLASLRPRSAMLVRAAEVRVRSNDVEHEFRQRSSMLYLTGMPEPESALLLAPGGVRIGDTLVREVLFVARRNPRFESYEGERMGPEIGAQVTGVPVAVSYSMLPEIVAGLVPSIDTLYYDGWVHRAAYEPLTGQTYFWDSENTAALQTHGPSVVVRDAGVILNERRLIKSRAELALLRRAVEITMEAHRRTISEGRPGMHEYELEAIMEYTFRRLGAEDAAYPSIVGSGPNTCILHYSTNRRRTQDGELVLMDCGAEYHGYAADITRTFPISGRFTQEQRDIYDLVLRAQEGGIAACRKGNEFRLPHLVAMGIIAEGLMALGIIEEESQASRYFNHGTSHYLGLDVHDVGAQGRLRPGMVLTVEPGIYIPEGSPCDRRWWNIGVRIEDDILVTDAAPENLSVALERTADDIEKLMARERGDAAIERRSE